MPKPSKLIIVGGIDHEIETTRYFAVSETVKNKLEVLIPTIRMALEQAHQAYEDTEDDTNAEIEAQDILNDLESALGLAKSFLSQAPQP